MSMIRTHIAEIPQKIGETITHKGHAQTVRLQSSVAFIVLREITGTVQCVVERGTVAFEKAKEITTESVISVTGTVVKTKSTESGFEIQASEIEIISLAEACTHCAPTFSIDRLMGMPKPALMLNSFGPLIPFIL